MDRVIVDTGFLVALGRAADPRHPAALRLFSSIRVPLVTVSAVIAESCHFLETRAKLALLDWILDDGPAVVDVPVTSYSDLSATIGKYAEREVDFADASLVWLAEATGHRKIITVDETDFSLFRLKGGKRFELIDWF